MAATLADVFSWESFGHLLKSGYDNLGIPSSDNESLYLDLVIYHASSDPLIFAIRAALFVAFICWFMSMATGTHSWVDRLWSITPIFYTIHYTVRDMLYWPKGEPFHYLPRVYIATALIFAWGVRLTYNFHRKGGYSFDSEDYRWPYLANKIPMGIWFLFNLFFICLYQNLLIVAITVPVYTAWRTTLVQIEPLNWIDVLATLLFIGGLTLETMADEQQWKFQEAKRKAIAKKEVLTGDFKRGFLTQGLFKSVYLYSVASGYPTCTSWINPSIVGVVSLTLLFQVSTWLTELMTSQKYPSYKQYQKTTSRFIPMPAGTSLDELERKSQ
ncbi:hypothetical protein BGZ65_004364 [Modicella reniformis]|uniref:DUF1295-domain-containing protein n=1 Tax=Modicella reniformis TaxID=1440133 RepID=A0A9P6J7Z6_9FUNG|nr:hypothetical protein BGZ65_004364 [Modicella reniformis]